MMAYSALGDSPDQAKQHEWKTGYWIWRMNDRPAGNLVKGMETDLLYVDAGSLIIPRNPDRASVEMKWPERLPKASVYFALLRAETVFLPPVGIIPQVVTGYMAFKEKAVAAGQQLKGLQLDFDCPTDNLGEYALFLKQLREALPAGDQLSITALLDWFRPGTKIAEVLQRVDEYVPQYYDVGISGISGSSGGVDDITGAATPIDPSKWAPIFNSHSRPYRIGISIFGRMSTSCTDEEGAAVRKKSYIRDYSTVEMISRRGLRLTGEAGTRAGEKILQFKATGQDRYSGCPGFKETVEMTIPTRESVFSAYNAAKQFGGWCTGVIFFRWPSENEAMVLSPDEVQSIIAEGKMPPSQSTVEVEDGFCAAVSCVNLYLRRIGDRFSPNPLTFRIHSSKDIEYILPGEGIKSGLAGRRTIQVILPPYAGDPRVYLGRVISREPASFDLEGRR